MAHLGDIDGSTEIRREYGGLWWVERVQGNVLVLALGASWMLVREFIIARSWLCVYRRERGTRVLTRGASSHKWI